MDPSILDRLCRLPIDLRTSANRSMVDLIRATGYVVGIVTSNDLKPVLEENRGLVEAWLSHSDDKRTDRGWYFKSKGSGGVVGYFPEGPELSFPDLASACAEFIVRELESIVTS